MVMCSYLKHGQWAVSTPTPMYLYLPSHPFPDLCQCQRMGNTYKATEVSSCMIAQTACLSIFMLPCYFVLHGPFRVRFE